MRTAFTLFSLLALLAACGSSDPAATIVGTWGLDVTAVEQEGAGLTEPMAKKMHENKLAMFRAMRVTLGADGRIELTGTPGDAKGTYKVDGVEGDDLTVTITYEGRAPETSSIHVQGGDRITMTSADKTLTFPLVRK